MSLQQPAKRTSRRAQAYERAERALDLPMLVLSVALIPILLIPLTIKDQTTTERGVLDTADYITWAAFVAEYVVKLGLAPRRWWFIHTTSWTWSWSCSRCRARCGWHDWLGIHVRPGFQPASAAP